MRLPIISNTAMEEFTQLNKMSSYSNINDNSISVAEVHDVEQNNISLFFSNPITSHESVTSTKSITSSSTTTSLTTDRQLEDFIEDTMYFSLPSTFQKDSKLEKIMPGIYLSKNFLIWNEENLSSCGFTHIIIIDKHIQELYYPSPIFQICDQAKANISQDPYEDCTVYDTISRKREALNFGNTFEAIDLNFGEKSYLTTVLPNCYRAVRFIRKALKTEGKILVIDCNGGEQKCITIVVAYLMYKYNISFRAAFNRLREYYKKADLDRFYTRQLYEYEPILQVQKAQSRGHSCSRDLKAAILKRKKNIEDDSFDTESTDDTRGNIESYDTCSLYNETLNSKTEKSLKSNLSSNRFEAQTECASTNLLFEEFKRYHSKSKMVFFDYDKFHDLKLKKISFETDHLDQNSDVFNNIMDIGMNEFINDKCLNSQKKRLKDEPFGIRCSAKFAQESTKDFSRNSMNFLNDFEMR